MTLLYWALLGAFIVLALTGHSTAAEAALAAALLVLVVPKLSAQQEALRRMVGEPPEGWL